MINLNKAQIYAKYEGNIDSWLKCADASEKSVFNEGDWAAIDDVVSKLSLQKYASSSQVANTERAERSYTPVTNDVLAKEQSSANEYSNIIEGDNYEDIISTLWAVA